MLGRLLRQRRTTHSCRCLTLGGNKNDARRVVLVGTTCLPACQKTSTRKVIVCGAITVEWLPFTWTTILPSPSPSRVTVSPQLLLLLLLPPLEVQQKESPKNLFSAEEAREASNGSVDWRKKGVCRVVLGKRSGARTHAHTSHHTRTLAGRDPCQGGPKAEPWPAPPPVLYCACCVHTHTGRLVSHRIRYRYRMESNRKEYRELNVVLVGDGRAGKSALLQRFVSDTFNSSDKDDESDEHDTYRPTVDANYVSKSLPTPPPPAEPTMTLEMHLCDTPGDKNFRSQEHYKGAAVGLVVHIQHRTEHVAFLGCVGTPHPPPPRLCRRFSLPHRCIASRRSILASLGPLSGARN